MRRLFIPAVLALMAGLMALSGGQHALGAANPVVGGTIAVDGSSGDWASVPLEFDTGARPCDAASWDNSGAKGRFVWDTTNVYALFEAYPATCGPFTNPNGPFDSINIEFFINGVGGTAFFLSECPDYDPLCSFPDVGETVDWSPDHMLIEVSIPISEIHDGSTFFNPSAGDFLEYRVTITDPDTAGGFDSRDQTLGWVVAPTPCCPPPATEDPGYWKLDFSPPAPRADKLAVRDSLSALLPTGDKNTDKKINDAIDHLDKSLDPALWVDDSRLDPKKGDKVFQEEKETVKKLQDIKDPPAAIAGLISQIVGADKLLAQTAIDDMAGGDPKKLAAANKELAKGNDEAIKGHYGPAIDHYKNAWKEAQKA
jgi:hypothetical protein